MALRQGGCPPSLLLCLELLGCGATFGKGLGLWSGWGPAHGAGAGQLCLFQLCAQSRNSPGIRGRRKRLGWKNPTPPTSQAQRLSHCGTGARGR